MSKDFIKLNVGGHKFLTTRATLSNRERSENSIFDKMFKDTSIEPIKDAKGYALIDRPGDHFGDILNFLRDIDLYVNDMDVKKRQWLLREAKHYELKELVKLLETRESVKTIDSEAKTRESIEMEQSKELVDKDIEPTLTKN